jgi:hypothetical protein
MNDILKSGLWASSETGFFKYFINTNYIQAGSLSQWKLRKLFMNRNVYAVATTKLWNLKIYNEKTRHSPGVWHLIT